MKRLLILKASTDVCPTEIGHITATAKLYQMAADIIEVNSAQELEKELNNGQKYDYVYLCAHANHQVFGDNQTGFNISWIDFGGILCQADCMNFGCIFLLACCRTGLNQVAYDLFWSCGKIEFICGPRWTLKPNDLTIAFNVFIYNMESRQTQPDEASKRMSEATGYSFNCFDRVEIEMKQDYRDREKYYWDYINKKYKIPADEIAARQERIE